MIPSAEGHKNPKVQSEALAWMETVLPQFGIASIKSRDLVAFLKSSLESSNVAVRKGATAVFVLLRIHIGPGATIEGENCKLTSINFDYCYCYLLLVVCYIW